jgi:hypothetical protein
MASYISVSRKCFTMPSEEKYLCVPISTINNPPDWRVLSKSDALIIYITGEDMLYIRTLQLNYNEKLKKRIIHHRSMAAPVPVLPKKETPGQGFLDFRENNENPA